MSLTEILKLSEIIGPVGLTGVVLIWLLKRSSVGEKTSGPSDAEFSSSQKLYLVKEVVNPILEAIQKRK